jgi:hypothetical protein
MGAQGAYDFVADDQRNGLANALDTNAADVRVKITHDDPRCALALLVRDPK